MISLVNLRQVNPDDYDLVWAIVRSLKENRPGIIQVKELSPSYQLFKDYLHLKETGQWDDTAFNLMYVPEFVKGLVTDTQSQAKLRQLFELDHDGLNIAIGCFCVNETLCHRSVVGGILKGLGANVNCRDAYTIYYTTFRNYMQSFGASQFGSTTLSDLLQI